MQAMQHRPRALSCQPVTQPHARLTCSNISEGHDCTQPCPAPNASSEKPAAFGVNNRFRASSVAEPNSSQAPHSKPVSRAASVNMGARCSNASRVASQLLASAALPGCILTGSFHRPVSSRSSLTQHDIVPQASTRRSARMHSRNSMRGSTPKHQPSMQSPPALTDLVQSLHHHRGEGTLALRSGITSPWSLSRWPILCIVDAACYALAVGDQQYMRMLYQHTLGWMWLGCRFSYIWKCFSTWRQLANCLHYGS